MSRGQVNMVHGGLGLNTSREKQKKIKNKKKNKKNTWDLDFLVMNRYISESLVKKKPHVISLQISVVSLFHFGRVNSLAHIVPPQCFCLTGPTILCDNNLEPKQLYIKINQK